VEEKMTAVTMTDLKSIFAFPFKDEKWQQKFLMGSLVTFAGFIIPVIPWFFLYGYVARVMRQVIIEKEQPALPEWDEWDVLFRDGAKLLGVSFIYMSPFLLLMFIGWMAMIVPSFIIPFLEMASSDYVGPMAVFGVMAGTFGGIAAFGIGMILAFVIGTFIPVALAHTVAEDSFKAAFRIKDWWAIFRANWGGFLISYVLIMGVWMIAMFAMQMLYMTMILCCLIPFLFAPLGFYGAVLMNTLFAQAYVEGQESLVEL
jgi:hypothetical protein